MNETLLRLAVQEFDSWDEAVAAGQAIYPEVNYCIQYPITNYVPPGMFSRHTPTVTQLVVRHLPNNRFAWVPTLESDERLIQSIKKLIAEAVETAKAEKVNYE